MNNNKPRLYKLVKPTMENTTPEDRVLYIAKEMLHDDRTVVVHEPHTALFAITGKVGVANITIEYDDDVDTLTFIILDDKRQVSKTYYYGMHYLHPRLCKKVEDVYASQMVDKVFKRCFKL